jgi:predicted aldo/keto reductase-like oxidoreductase
MEKARLGKTEMMVSKLAFGSIPIQRVPEDEAIAIIRRCMELGITFIDTAIAYTTSEGRIGKAISGQREGLILATKSPARTREEMERHLKQSLEQLGVKSIDLYQLHNVSDFDAYEKVLEPGGPLAVLQEAKRAGQVKHIGITSHNIDVAKEAVKSDRFETIMFPFNFITAEPFEKLLPLAREHNVGFIAMKPLAGGMLDNVAIAFKYLLQFPEVIPVVGIEKIHEIDEIIPIFEGPWEMTEAEQKEMLRLKEELGTRFCRRCDYCQPCTAGIFISQVMNLKSFLKRMPPDAVFSGQFAASFEKALECTECGDCETRCPYGLPVMEMVKEYSNQYQAEKKKYQEQKASARSA